MIAEIPSSEAGREILGMDVSPSAAETLRAAFFRKPVHRGDAPITAGAREGIKAAIRKVLNANRQRCRMRLMRRCPADAGRSGRRIVLADLSFQAQHRAKLHSADPIERPDGETRRTKMSRDRGKTIIRLKDADVRRSCFN